MKYNPSGRMIIYMHINEWCRSVCYCHRLEQNYSATDDNQGQTVGIAVPGKDNSG